MRTIKKNMKKARMRVIIITNPMIPNVFSISMHGTMTSLHQANRIMIIKDINAREDDTFTTIRFRLKSILTPPVKPIVYLIHLVPPILPLPHDIFGGEV